MIFTKENRVSFQTKLRLWNVGDLYYFFLNFSDSWFCRYMLSLCKSTKAYNRRFRPLILVLCLKVTCREILTRHFRSHDLSVPVIVCGCQMKLLITYHEKSGSRRIWSWMEIDIIWNWGSVLRAKLLAPKLLTGQIVSCVTERTSDRLKRLEKAWRHVSLYSSKRKSSLWKCHTTVIPSERKLHTASMLLKNSDGFTVSLDRDKVGF